MRNLKLMVKLVWRLFPSLALITLVIGYAGWRSVDNLDGNLREISEVRLHQHQISAHHERTDGGYDKSSANALLDPNLEMAARNQQ